MLFNSFEFIIFFPVVCIIYFLLKNNRWRIPFLLIASYYFYMNWKPVYALLIMTSTVLTYCCGLLVERYNNDKSKKKAFLVISLVLNFSILFLFKYFNFIGQSITTLFSMCGLAWHIPNLDVLLPVGISFYTFQAVGYSVDVYRGTIKAEHNFMTYALFVSFFPQLVAGPIERAKNLLPQFHEEHQFHYDDAVNGLKQMLWGFFMKIYQRKGGKHQWKNLEYKGRFRAYWCTYIEQDHVGKQRRQGNKDSACKGTRKRVFDENGQHFTAPAQQSALRKFWIRRF